MKAVSISDNFTVGEPGLFLTVNEVAILKDILDSLDEESLIDQEIQLIGEIQNTKF